MTSPAPVEGNPQSQAPQVVKADGATAELAATAESKYGKAIDSTTKIGSFNELKSLSPELYDETLKAIAYGIIRQMRESEERRQKRAKEYNRE